MKIFGSGVGVTTLQISGTSVTAHHYIAIGRSRLDSLDTAQGSNVEISDLTIDCNFQSTVQLSAAAIQLSGTHLRIRNVYAKNWGNRDSARRAVISATTFAAKTSGTFSAVSTVDSIIEDCIVADASAAYDEEDTDKAQMVGIEVGGFADDGQTNIQGFGMGPVIRNCFIEGKVDSTTKRPLVEPKIQGVAMELCYGGIIEGNQFHNLWVGGPGRVNQPSLNTRRTRELIVRNNIYKNVVGGVVFWKFDTYGPQVAVKREGHTSSPGPERTLFETNSTDPHHLFVGVRVKLEGFSGFSGDYQLYSVPTLSTFEVLGPDTSGSGTYRIVYGVAKLVVENNYFELAAVTTETEGIPSIADANKKFPCGIYLSSQASPPGKVYGEVLLRANKFRYFNGQTDSNFTGTAIQAASIEKGMIRDNYIETVPANPLQIWDCGGFGFLNNRKPDGTLVLGLNNTTGEKSDEIQTEAEDALVLALFNER